MYIDNLIERLKNGLIRTSKEEEDKRIYWFEKETKKVFKNNRIYDIIKESSLPNKEELGKIKFKECYILNKEKIERVIGFFPTPIFLTAEDDKFIKILDKKFGDSLSMMSCHFQEPPYNQSGLIMGRPNLPLSLFYHELTHSAHYTFSKAYEKGITEEMPLKYIIELKIIEEMAAHMASLSASYKFPDSNFKPDPKKDIDEILGKMEKIYLPYFSDFLKSSGEKNLRSYFNSLGKKLSYVREFIIDVVNTKYEIKDGIQLLFRINTPQKDLKKGLVYSPINDLIELKKAYKQDPKILHLILRSD